MDRVLGAIESADSKGRGMRERIARQVARVAKCWIENKSNERSCNAVVATRERSEGALEPRAHNLLRGHCKGAS
jgi:hypothetical protein